MSIGFHRRNLSRTWAKAVLEKKLERKVQCYGGENVEGQNKDRGRAYCDGREGKGGTLGQGTVLDLKGTERDMKESADKGEQAIHCGGSS